MPDNFPQKVLRIYHAHETPLYLDESEKNILILVK